MPRSRACGCAIWHAWAALARLRPAEPASTVPALRRVGRSPMLGWSASTPQTHQLAPRSRRSHGITHLAVEIAAYLGPELDQALARVAEAYDGVYLVGGTVRDILLGRPNFDVDVAVEGDAIEFSRKLANELGGRCHPHGQFGTAVVHYGEGEHVDAVTARREVYATPAALPTVERAGIQEDLFRRDFTINAMALSLKAPRPRRARRSVRRTGRSRPGSRPRPPRRVVRRRPDAHFPRGALREPVRLSDGRAHGVACARSDRRRVGLAFVGGALA